MAKKDYALAAFNMEQAVQLELKYLIGKRLGDFPRAHSLRALFQKCVKICPTLKQLYDANLNLIGEIKDAYVMTRYIEEVYEEQEVKNKLRFYLEVLHELEKCD